MSLFYQHLFKLRIMHDFYNLGYGSDFKIVPLPQTEAIMRRHRLIMKEAENGFDIASLMQNESTPLADLGEDTKLSFALILSNKSFHNFTALDALDSSSQAYHIHNLDLDALELTQNGWNQVEMANSSLFYTQTAEADTVDLTITDPFDTEILNEEMEQAGTQFSHLFQLGNRAEGLYTFSHSIDEVAQADERYYLAQDLKHLRPFAIVDFYSSELDYENTKTYTLQFEAKRSQWTYLLSLSKDYSGYTIGIEDTRDNPEASFKSTGDNALTEGSVLTFSSFKASDDSQELEIPFDETSIPDFDLILEKNGDRTELQGLPNPSIHHTKTEMHINI